MNAAAFDALGKLEPAQYVGPISPPVILRQKAISKLFRVSGFRGAFYFFSERRLKAVADEVEARCDVKARFDFFHGFTPWILSTPARPYVAWCDCTFRDYIDIYSCREQFRPADLARIERQEAAWLKTARLVLFTSNWAAMRAVEQYGLDANTVQSVGIFGSMEMPKTDVYGGGKEFVFVSTNFQAKGGPLVVSAFRRVKKAYPEASLIIVGDRPKLTMEAGVSFVGFLRKEIPQEYSRLRQILQQGLAVVHPTQSDVTPLLLVEAGYFGCPAISARRFAIPELVDHGRTGLLLNDPIQTEDVAQAMLWMLEHDQEYFQMRRAAWTRAHVVHSQRRFEERLLECVSKHFSDCKIRA